MSIGEFLIGLMVLAALLLILGVLAPNVALALIAAIERLVRAFLKLPRVVAQKVKRKTD